jgi:hypothetical protein
MAKKEYTIGCLSLYNISDVATHIGLQQFDLAANVEASDDGSGSLYAEHMSVTGVSPVASFTTKCLASLLGFVGINGQCVGTGLAVTKVDGITRRMENCDEALGGSPHIRDRVSKGLLRLGSLNAARGQDATITGMVDALSDGTNAPVVRTDGVALPTGVVSQRFTLGKCAFANTTFDNLEQVGIEFNVQTDEKLPAEAMLWPETIGVLTVRPVIVFGARDVSKITNTLLAAGASAATHANSIIQLVKRQSAGSFVAAATEEHIRFTLAGLMIPENIASAAAQAKATGSLRIPCHYDGTNAPVTVDVTAAYDSTPI